MLLHVVTEKGHGFPPAEEDPTTFHAPAPFERKTARSSCSRNRPGGRPTPSWSATPCWTRCTSTEDRRHHRRDVPGQHARADPREVSRPVLRRGHLRVARGGAGRRAGQGRAAAGGRYLQHLPAAELRSAFPRGLAPEPADHVAVGPVRPGGARRTDAPRHVRSHVFAAAAESRRDGARRRVGRGAHARLGLGARRTGSHPLREASAEAIARTALPVELGKAEVIGQGQGRVPDGLRLDAAPLREAAKRLAAEGARSRA